MTLNNLLSIECSGLATSQEETLYSESLRVLPWVVSNTLKWFQGQMEKEGCGFLFSLN